MKQAFFSVKVIRPYLNKHGKSIKVLFGEVHCLFRLIAFSEPLMKIWVFNMTKAS